MPTFKAGDEFYIAHTGALWYDGGGDDYEDDVCAYATQTLMKFPNILTDWFEPIDDEDTNVLSKEPLIKDEKARKVIRAWADANIILKEAVLYDKDRDCIYSPYVSDDSDTSVSLSFDSRYVFEKLEHRRLYTFEELCGEEE